MDGSALGIWDGLMNWIQDAGAEVEEKGPMVRISIMGRDSECGKA